MTPVQQQSAIEQNQMPCNSVHNQAETQHDGFPGFLDTAQIPTQQPIGNLQNSNTLMQHQREVFQMNQNQMPCNSVHNQAGMQPGGFPGYPDSASIPTQQQIGNMENSSTLVQPQQGTFQMNTSQTPYVDYLASGSLNSANQHASQVPVIRSSNQYQRQPAVFQSNNVQTHQQNSRVQNAPQMRHQFAQQQQTSRAKYLTPLQRLFPGYVPNLPRTWPQKSVPQIPMLLTTTEGRKTRFAAQPDNLLVNRHVPTYQTNQTEHVVKEHVEVRNTVDHSATIGATGLYQTGNGSQPNDVVPQHQETSMNNLYNEATWNPNGNEQPRNDQQVQYNAEHQLPVQQIGQDYQHNMPQNIGSNENLTLEQHSGQEFNNRGEQSSFEPNNNNVDALIKYFDVQTTGYYSLPVDTSELYQVGNGSQPSDIIPQQQDTSMNDLRNEATGNPDGSEQPMSDQQVSHDVESQILVQQVSEPHSGTPVNDRGEQSSMEPNQANFNNQSNLWHSDQNQRNMNTSENLGEVQNLENLPGNDQTDQVARTQRLPPISLTPRRVDSVIRQNQPNGEQAGHSSAKRTHQMVSNDEPQIKRTRNFVEKEEDLMKEFFFM